MSMKDAIRQKRKELDFTQEQIARQLGVSIPAVSKWESGATYPDVAMISALARVLKTDVNTLLCFKQELSEQEIGEFINEISKVAMAGNLEKAFVMAEEKIKEFPTDAALLHMTAMTLQGVMLMVETDEAQKKEYDHKILQIYERVGKSDNRKYAHLSNFMLASRAIGEAEYERAQELIDRLPEYNDLDKRMLQARLWMSEGKLEEAGNIYARKAIAEVNSLQMPLVQLIHIAMEQGDTKQADRLVKCGQELTELFGFWNYNTHLFALEKAIVQQNAKESLAVLSEMIEALLVPWEKERCPFFEYIESKKESVNFGEKMLSNILSELEHNPEYDFLREEPEFLELIVKYQKK